MFTRLQQAFHRYLPRDRSETPPDQPTLDLLDEVTRLPGGQRPALAHEVAALWVAFAARFGGPHGFSSAGEGDKQAYNRQLAEFVARFAALRGTDREHALLSVALMLQYTSLIGRTDLTPAERRVSALVAGMISGASPTVTAVEPAKEAAPDSGDQPGSAALRTPEA